MYHRSGKLPQHTHRVNDHWNLQGFRSSDPRLTSEWSRFWKIYGRRPRPLLYSQWCQKSPFRNDWFKSGRQHLTHQEVRQYGDWSHGWENRRRWRWSVLISHWGSTYTYFVLEKCSGLVWDWAQNGLQGIGVWRERRNATLRNLCEGSSSQTSNVRRPLLNGWVWQSVCVIQSVWGSWKSQKAIVQTSFQWTISRC